MKQDIIQHDNDPSGLLRAHAERVTKEDFAGGRVPRVLKKMKHALASRDDGVALAAPQIGEPMQMFVVSGKIFDTKQTQQSNSDLVFINPEIQRLSDETVDMEEGCLSVSDTYGKVRRAKVAIIEAQDEDGERVVVEGSGLLAQIFQHECDHLHGILFTDKAHGLHKEPHEQ